jgi:5''-3'' exonuclease (including N-terminal domain of PolI)
MCILAGCDYCEGIPGIGIQTAHKIVRMHRKPSKIFKILGSTGKLPQGFEEIFWTAYNTFRHQRIYCLEKGVIEPLFPIEQDSSNDAKGRWQFLGAWLEPSIGRGIADGSLHPVYHIPWTQISGQCEQNNIHSSSSCADDEFQKGRTRKNRSDQRSSLFAFFKNDKAIVSSHETIKPNGQQRRLPLQEITRSHHESDDLLHNNRNSNNTFDRGHAMVPTHFYDYSSKLVSISFQPLSRNTSTQRYFQKRKGASKAIKKLKNRLSLKRVQEIDNARRSAQQEDKDCTEQKMFENIQQHGYSSTSNIDTSDERNDERKEMTKVEHSVDEFNNALGLVETMTSSNGAFLLPTEDEFSRYNFPDFDYFADLSLPLYDCHSTTNDHDTLQRGNPQVHEEHNAAPQFLEEDMSIYCSDDPVVTHRFEQQNTRSFSSDNNCRFQDFGEVQFLLQNVQMTDHADGGHTNNEGSTAFRMMEKQQATIFEDRMSHFDYETFHDENQSRTDPDEPSQYFPTNKRDPIQNDYEAFVGLHPF